MKKGIAVLIGMLLLFLWLMFSGCMSIKKAEQLVLTNPQAFDNTGKKWAKLNPCANDTVINYLPGRVDSIRLSEVVPYFDSFAYQIAVYNYADTLGRKCDTAVQMAYKAGFDNAVSKFGRIKIPKQIDTAKYMILDKRGWKLLEDSLIRAENRIERTEATMAGVSDAAKDYKRERDKWLWYFIAACIALGVSNGIWIYAKIKTAWIK